MKMRNPYSEIEYSKLYSSIISGCELVQYRNIFGVFDSVNQTFKTLPGFTLFDVNFIDVQTFFDFYGIQKAFLLCRKMQDMKLADDKGIFSFEARGLIGFEGLDDEGFWSKLQQSARKDSSRVLRKLHRSGLFAQQTNVVSDIINFVDMHNSLQIDRGFVVPQNFRVAELEALINLQNWLLLKISKDNAVLGYTILAICGDVVDQVFLVYDSAICDSSRFVIYSSLEYAINRLSAANYFMGGGIAENDNLESYKISLGAKKNTAKILKYCAFQAQGYCDGIKLAGARWP